MKRLAIIGASGHGKVVADAAECLGWSVSFFDDFVSAGTVSGSWTVLGDTAHFIETRREYEGVVVGIGDNTVRLEKTQHLLGLGLEPATIIHPRATVSSHASLGPGSVVFAGAVVNVDCELGTACIVNTGATVDHDCQIGHGVHISPGAHLAGGVVVGDQSWVGIGSSIREGIHIGRRVIVGAGSVVVKHVRDGEKVMGVPAVPFKRFDERGGSC